MAKRIRKRDLIIEFLQLITGIGLKKGKKAAPRFELGIKDLQSSALPLGHAAVEENQLLSADRISHSARGLLVLCNGHGEDLIAMRVLDEIHRICPGIKLEVLPLVGEGKVFSSAISDGWLKCLGPVARLPSGGFSNQSFSGLVSDLAAGLIKITFKHWRYVRHNSLQGNAILAVGDFLPLFFAWSSGGQFGFIGTPKSDYTWRSGPGSAFSDHYHRLKGTEWDPWECFLMRSSRCRMVAVRDHLTARGLRRKGVIAHAPGNPMMDGLSKSQVPDCIKFQRRLLLLCGSRMPEAGENFKRLLYAASLLKSQNPRIFLVPLGSEPTVEQIEASLIALGYQLTVNKYDSFGAEACWIKGQQIVVLGSGQFFAWASWAEVGLATAGTATEQLVGLGIPAVSLPGQGPQFKLGFAQRQSRLLGGAVITCRSVDAMVEQLDVLLTDEESRQQIGAIGSRRMGPAGGSIALASLVSRLLIIP